MHSSDSRNLQIMELSNNCRQNILCYKSAPLHHCTDQGQILAFCTKGRFEMFWCSFFIIFRFIPLFVKLSLRNCIIFGGLVADLFLQVERLECKFFLTEFEWKMSNAVDSIDYCRCLCLDLLIRSTVSVTFC